MRVLFWLYKDSTNYASINIIRAFINAGHEVIVCSKYMECANVRMFEETDIELMRIDDLTTEIIDACDVMFVHTVYWGDKRVKSKKYTFFFNHIFVYGHENNSDFVFTQCDDKYATFPNKVVMKIGNPKFDNRNVGTVKQAEKKQILVVETGHYPFGSQGKEQIARMILEIAYNFEDYKILVKPRFLPGNIKNLTRTNRDHIYTYIYNMAKGKLPENLELMDHYSNLDELINESHSVVCYGSSSYLEAAVRGKGVIYINDIISEEANGERKNKYWKAFNEFISDSGCVVSYSEVIRYLPDGIMCSKMHMDKAVNIKEGVAEKIVEVVEYVWKNFLSKGVFPAIGHYNYQSYKREMIVDNDLSAEVLSRNNIYDVLNYQIQKLYREINADISFDEAIKMLDKWKNNGFLNRDNEKKCKELLLEKLGQIILENRKELEKDRLDSAVLMRSLYRQGQGDKLLSEADLFKYKEALIYFQGMVLFERKDYGEVCKILPVYLDYVQKMPYAESFILTSSYVKNAVSILLISAVCCEKRQVILDVLRKIKKIKVVDVTGWFDAFRIYCEKNQKQRCIGVVEKFRMGD